MKKISVLLFTTFLCAQAFADEPAKADCKQPTIPIPQASDIVVKYFNKHRDAYESCIGKFVKAQQEIAKSESNAVKANAAHDAAEAAINEYNTFMAELKDRNGRSGADSGDDPSK